MKYRIGCALAAGALIAALNLTAAAAGDPEKGKVVYDTIGACASCHGPTGDGDGAAAAALDPKPRKFSDGKFMFDTDGDGKTGTVNDLKNVINKGGKEFGGSIMMAARPDITGDKLDNLVAYVLTLAGK